MRNQMKIVRNPVQFVIVKLLLQTQNAAAEKGKEKRNGNWEISKDTKRGG